MKPSKRDNYTHVGIRIPRPAKGLGFILLLTAGIVAFAFAMGAIGNWLKS